jgi:hypothetical protein
MNDMRMFGSCVVLCLSASAVICSAAETMTLENEKISVALSARGLSQIHDKDLACTFRLDGDHFSLTVNDDVIDRAADPRRNKVISTLPGSAMSLRRWRG